MKVSELKRDIKSWRNLILPDIYKNVKDNSNKVVMEILGKKMHEETSVSDKNRYHRPVRKQSCW